VTAFTANFDALSVLVNAAGVLRLRQEYDPAEFSRVVDVNLTGTMRMAVGCRAALANTKGAIVNIASMHAIFGAPLSPAYAASKAGGMRGLAGRMQRRVLWTHGDDWDPTGSSGHADTMARGAHHRRTLVLALTKNKAGWINCRCGGAWFGASGFPGAHNSWRTITPDGRHQNAQRLGSNSNL
jgi:hypothetical protein